MMAGESFVVLQPWYNESHAPQDDTRIIQSTHRATKAKKKHNSETRYGKCDKLASEAVAFAGAASCFCEVFGVCAMS